MNDDMKISMDANSLYKEEMYTDRKMGTIRILTPVNSDGSFDVERETLYVGQAQLMTPMGALPLAFEINADSLADAVEKYAQEAKAAVDKTMEELQELRRQQASSIVIPESGGGVPWGGKIQFP